MKHFWSLAGLLVLSATSIAQVNIIPQPVELKLPESAGNFQISSKTPIILEGSGLEKSAAFLNDYLKQFYGFSLPVKKKAGKDAGIRLHVEKLDGAYHLNVSNKGVDIAGSDTAAFYGIQTLIQLLPVEKAGSLSVPYVSIKDKPRFQYRGLHLDVSRHFMPIAFVKKIHRLYSAA